MTIGIYKMVHKKTRKYYIGSSKNIEGRKSSHMSFFRSGRHHKKLQELYNIDNEFEFFILEECRICDLKKKEKKHLKQCVGIDSRCVNIVSTGMANTRNKKKSTEHKLRLMKSMIGKNGQPRLNTVTKLVSPDDIEYDVISIKQFAEEHGLCQSALNSVANGRSKYHHGWRLLDTKLKEDVSCLDVDIVGPDGKVITIKNINEFESEHGITVHGKYKINKKFLRSVRSIDEYGRGWYVKNNVPSYTFQNVKTNEVIENVICTPKFAKKFGIRQQKLSQLIIGRRKKTQDGWIVKRFCPSNINEVTL